MTFPSPSSTKKRIHFSKSRGKSKHVRKRNGHAATKRALDKDQENCSESAWLRSHSDQEASGGFSWRQRSCKPRAAGANHARSSGFHQDLHKAGRKEIPWGGTPSASQQGDSCPWQRAGASGRSKTHPHSLTRAEVHRLRIHRDPPVPVSPTPSSGTAAKGWDITATGRRKLQQQGQVLTRPRAKDKAKPFNAEVSAGLSTHFGVDLSC